MMSNKVKKVLAVVLAMVMVMGMSITSYAAGETSGTGTGEGTFEGSVDKEVISVTLPTTDETTFDFILDPEGLIAATSKAKYPDASFEDGANVFFQSAANTYTDESAKLKVINKGTVDVDITVKASVATDKAIDFATDSMTGKKLSEIADTVGSKVIMATAGADENVKVSDLPILYLGLQVANQTAEAVRTTSDTTTPADVAVGVKGKADNYEVTYSTEGGYKFTVKAGVAETAWNSMEFNLVGKCNTAGDWSTSALAAPTVTLTWSYAERTDETNPLLTENAVLDSAPVFSSSEANVITFTKGVGNLAMADGESITYIAGTWGENTYDKTAKVTIDYEAGTITAKDNTFGVGAEPVPVTIKYTNKAGEEITVTSVSIVIPAE